MNILELLDGLRFDTMPAGANAASKAPSQPEVSSPEPKTIQIFLASLSEFRAERDAFDLYVRQQNDRLRQIGFYLEVIRWKTSSMP